jgi:hypothetical protein
MLSHLMVSLIPLFKEKQQKPAWIFDAGTLIWRIYFTSNNLIVGETRNQETKSTSFFCVDIRTGTSLWNNMSFDEPWWIGIEAVHKKWMILHGFVRPDIPEHRGIRVVDIESGKLLWKNDDLSFWFIDNEKLYAHKYLFERHIACELDINTGMIVQEYSGNLDTFQTLRERVMQDEAGRQSDVIFPDLFDEKDAEPVLRTVVQQMTEGRALEGWIEYLSLHGILILSHYRQTKNQSDASLLNNILSVYDLKAEKTLYSEIIAREVKAPSPDSFFVKDNLVLFVNHQTMLTALQPWKS